MAHTATQPDQSEVQTPQDFSFNSEDLTSCSHPQCNLTTAEEATELMQALEASKEEDVKRQTYEAIKAREDEYKRRGIAWNLDQARLKPRTGPLGATGKGARVKKQPERFGASIPSATISPPKRRPQTGFKCPKFALEATPKPEKARRLPKDRKKKIVRAVTPSPATSANTTAENIGANTTADQELSRLASHFTSQLDYMSVEEIRQQAGVEQHETTNDNIESSPEA